MKDQSPTRNGEELTAKEAIQRALEFFEQRMDTASAWYYDNATREQIAIGLREALSETKPTMDDLADAENAERYRCFRDQCDYDRQLAIVESAEGVADMLDHHLDKARCGL